MASPVDIVSRLLNNMTDPDMVESLVAPNATYVSLSYSNPDLKKIMPWCGSYEKAGPEAFNRTFSLVAKAWKNVGSTIHAIFGDGGNVAAFGEMTLRSNALGVARTTPFAVWCVVREGKIGFMQFLEDTFATASTFRKGGEWEFETEEGAIVI